MNVWDLILHLIVVTLLSAVLSVLAILVIRQTGIDLRDVKKRTHPLVLLIALLFNLAFIVSVAVILKFWDHQSLAVLGFTLGIKSLLFVVFGLIFSVSFALWYVYVLHGRKIVEVHFGQFDHSGAASRLGTAFGFLVLFVAALQEEVLFRGYFSFVLLPHGFWMALIISSVIFTLWHFLTNKAGIFQTTDWLIGGIILYYIYWISGSIWVATFIHFSRNLTNVLVFDISGSHVLLRYKAPVTPAFKSLYTILFSILIMLAGTLVFR